jgi:hypothetical protein
VDDDDGVIIRSPTVKPNRSPNEFGDTATMTGNRYPSIGDNNGVVGMAGMVVVVVVDDDHDDTNDDLMDCFRYCDDSHGSGSVGIVNSGPNKN